MSPRIAIQPDEILHRKGERQSYSDRWFQRAAERGIDAIPVDVSAPDVIAQIAGCDAFMWRYDPAAYPRVYARRLMYAVEAGLGLPVFPAFKSAWHFEDKIGQYYFLKAAGIPVPESWIFWHRDQARQFCRSATYPFVLKLATGYQSRNVRLIRSAAEALYYVDQMFDHGVVGVGWNPASPARLLLRRLRAAAQVAAGNSPWGPTAEAELQFGYFFAQEFLPGNRCDARITVIGDRAFGFRRSTPPGDFRASGSGLIDWDPEPIDERAVRLALKVAEKLGSQTVGVDILLRDGQPVVLELNLAYASWAVRDCPGHWVLHGRPETGSLEWVEGSMHPEDVLFDDFVAALSNQPVPLRRAAG